MMINYLLLFSICSIVLSLELSHVAGTEVPKIRGVPLSKISLYNADKDFECFDGSRKMLFSRVNDDYCDCADGSDEPGTAACQNGVFHCSNAGHKDINIPSSRVNDGICDCCDASDEYESNAKCINNCHELGKEAQAKAQEAKKLAKEGYAIRLELASQGKKLQSENSANLLKLKADHQEAELLKKEKEIIKTQAEERKNIALEKYKILEPEIVQEAPAEVPREMEAEDFFRLLDVDESQTITLEEMKNRDMFDRDQNGIVTDEEAMHFLGHQDTVNLDEFIEKAWINIKPIVNEEQEQIDAPNHGEEEEEEEEEEGEEHHEEELEGDHNGDFPDDHENAEGEGAPEGEPEKVPEAAPEIQYDDETQALIDEANEAETQYHQAEKAALDLLNEIRSLEGKIERDYGPDYAFASLDGECFKYTDMEYVYSLCMYGRATQSSKSGGGEVNLGQWSEWTGPQDNKYSKMKYDRGLTCWNGPARTVDVELQCGTENKLISVSEPSRCEYAMVLTTPTLCDPNAHNSGLHDEL